MSAGSEAVEEILSHYGVRGMHWGVRKSGKATTVVVKKGRGLTSGKTKIKTTGGKNRPATKDAANAAVVKQVLKKSGSHALSNQQLKDLATRLSLEKQVTDLTPDPKGKQAVKFIMSKKGQQTVKTVSDSPATKAVGKALKRKVAIAAATAALA